MALTTQKKQAIANQVFQSVEESVFRRQAERVAQHVFLSGENEAKAKTNLVRGNLIRGRKPTP